jgi:hypothetical protein
LDVHPCTGGSSVIFLVSRRSLVAHLHQENLQEGGWVADTAYLQPADNVSASLHEMHRAAQLEIERLQAELTAARMDIEDARMLIEDLEERTKHAEDSAEVPATHRSWAYGADPEGVGGQHQQVPALPALAD